MHWSKQKPDFDVSKSRLHRGVPLPAIHPDTGRDERFVIQLIEPMEDNEAALGLDIGFEPMRYAAAQLARETNEIRLTEAITLVQDKRTTSGFLLLRRSMMHRLICQIRNNGSKHSRAGPICPLPPMRFSGH
ncbi:CHASE domain-containing protein [Sulfitobacter sp. S223]|uniref:CHASE domain-containing protein n=1 Tax=Sulfitobacter sp. S223 TaxID=2867023 RepID=UPI002882FEF0|nr:CHASE domain-containing protein [Sulfitobacter sp. S223]